MKSVIAIVAIAAAVCGCAWDKEMGSRTVVGNHRVLPKVCTNDGNAEIDIYETVEGAVITTRKDSKVEVEYDNAYTNSIFGVWDWWGRMKLKVYVEPLAVDVVDNAPTPREAETQEDEPPPDAAQ